DDAPMTAHFAAVRRAMFAGEITPDEAKVMAAFLEAEDKTRERAVAAKEAAETRRGNQAINTLLLEVNRAHLDEPLGQQLPPPAHPPGPAVAAHPAPHPDPHADCNAPPARPPPAPPRGEGQGGGAPPGDGVVQARPPPHPNPLPGGEREGSHLHSPCISPHAA